MSGKWFVVFSRKNPGVYEEWDDCWEQVGGVKGSMHKSYPTRAKAEMAWDKHLAKKVASKQTQNLEKYGSPYLGTFLFGKSSSSTFHGSKGWTSPTMAGETQNEEKYGSPYMAHPLYESHKEGTPFPDNVDESHVQFDGINEDCLLRFSMQAWLREACDVLHIDHPRYIREDIQIIDGEAHYKVHASLKNEFYGRRPAAVSSY
ncbi:Ribosomal protein L9/RNase H1, N-terminal [Sesbania bispinosa]|nr:Ribosomal protein L9/RNase H1, N-terminal [Sesbania bispinosa]